MHALPLTGSARAWAEWSLQLGQARQRGWAALFQQAQPGGRVVWVPHGAHHVYLSHPVDVAQALDAFLRGP